MLRSSEARWKARHMKQIRIVTEDPAYEAVLSSLDSIRWDLASEHSVTKIEPTGKHVNLNFFPGQR